jgi:hypothetical protein
MSQLLYYCQYVPLDCASGFVLSAKLSKTTRFLSITREGEGAGAIMSGPLIKGISQTAAHFQFSFIVLLHGCGVFFNFNTRRLLQLQSSSPTSSLVAFIFNPRHLQLQSLLPTSSPTSTLVAFNFNPRCHSISKPRRFSISSPSP